MEKYLNKQKRTMTKQQADVATLKALGAEYRHDDVWAEAYNQYRKEENKRRTRV